MVLVFLVMVPLPVGLAAWYLAERALPQYASSFGFVIHTEGESAAGGLLAAIPAIGSLGGSSSKDTDILARYLRSQALVGEVDAMLDLRAAWSGGHATDPVFAFNPSGTIEDLARYWRRMVSVHYDYGAGLMEVEVRSFDAAGAQAIARAVEEASSRLINNLSGIARTDRMRHATRELRLAEDRLVRARQALMEFRAEHRLIDPMADLTGDMEVIAQLQRELAEEGVAAEVLRKTLEEGRAGKRREEISDSRIRQSERRMEVIRQTIAAERRKIGGADDQKNYARLVGEYERLKVNVEVAQQAHVAALATHDATRAEADRQSRYVATYADAGLPERAVYPRTARIVALVAAAAFLGWSVVMLVIYSLRDRY